MQRSEVTDDCRAVHQQLLGEWLGESDESTSSLLLHHVSKCRGCLKRYIALQAAADLALNSSPLSDKIGQSSARWRPLGLPGTDGTW